MRPPNPNSKRGKIHAAFLTGGVNEAMRVGRDLNWSDGGIRSWCKKWQLELGDVAPVKQGTKHVITDKGQVRLSYDPDRVGVITRPGDEVSEVKFANGVYRFVPNHHLEPVKSKPGR